VLHKLTYFYLHVLKVLTCVYERLKFVHHLLEHKIQKKGLSINFEFQSRKSLQQIPSASVINFKNAILNARWQSYFLVGYGGLIDIFYI